MPANSTEMPMCRDSPRSGGGCAGRAKTTAARHRVAGHRAPRPQPRPSSCPTAREHERREADISSATDPAARPRRQRPPPTSAPTPTSAGRRQVAAQVRGRCPAPRDHRPYPRQQHQDQRQRNDVAVEPRRPDRRLVAVTASEISGKNVPQKITKQSPTSTRLLSRKTASRDSSESRRCSERSSLARESTSATEPAISPQIRIKNGTAERRGAEGVDRVEDPRAHEEGAEDRQHAGGQHERDVPDLQHPALLLDHHGVQERRADQPRHQRRVLHRIPGPVAAPAELGVGPAGAEQDPDPEEEPGGERERPREPDPLRVQPPRDQRADRERERHREQRVARVQHRGVDHHARVAQQRVEPGALGHHGRRAVERVLQEHQQRQEEDGEAE